MSPGLSARREGMPCTPSSLIEMQIEAGELPPPPGEPAPPAARPRHLAQQARRPVVVEHRRRLPGVPLQPAADRLLAVVLPLHELAAAPAAPAGPGGGAGAGGG